MIDILAQLADNGDVWLIGALASVGAFVAFIVKWILNYMKAQAKESAERADKQLEMRGKEVKIQTQVHNTMCDLVEKIERQNGKVPVMLEKVLSATDRNTEAINNLCTTLNKRFSTDSFKKEKT